jgi:hypothetical protein
VTRPDPPVDPPRIRPYDLPATYGCMVLVFFLLLILAVTDLLRRAGVW